MVAVTCFPLKQNEKKIQKKTLMTCKLTSGSAFHNLDVMRSENSKTTINSLILVITGQSRNINIFLKIVLFFK